MSLNQKITTGGQEVYIPVSSNLPPITYKKDNTVGSVKSWTVPANEIWKITFAHCILIATATVGNRQINFSLLDPDGDIATDFDAGAVQAASTTLHYTFMQGVYRETGFIDNEIECPISSDLYLLPGFSVTFQDDKAIDAAGDQLKVWFEHEIFKV